MNKQVLEEDVKQFTEHFDLWEKLKGKTFLITGATGLIGSVMIRCLLALNKKYALGIRILAVIRSIDKAEAVFGDYYDDIEFVQLPLAAIKTEDIKDQVDFIIHLASPTAGKYMEEHPVETFDLAYTSTFNLLNYSLQNHVAGMVYVSSLEYYGQMFDDRHITEDMQGFVDSTSARSSYPMGKRAAEYLCYAFAKEYGASAKVARLTQTLGAGISENDNRVFAQFSRSIIKNEDIVLHTTGESAKPYCYTTDCVSAILYILLNGQKGEAYNVANSDTYISIRGLAEFLQQYFNPAISIRIELNENMGYAPVTKLRLSTEKLQSLGWKPMYGLKDIFDRVIKYIS